MNAIYSTWDWVLVGLLWVGVFGFIIAVHIYLRRLGQKIEDLLKIQSEQGIHFERVVKPKVVRNSKPGNKSADLKGVH